MTTISREAHDREMFHDQQAQRVRCSSCGTPLLSEHGIINASADPPTGTTWWQCPNSDCGRRVKEDYEYDLEQFKIFTLTTEEV